MHDERVPARMLQLQREINPFVRVSDPAALREELLSSFGESDLLGTTLIATEGVNGTMAGSAATIDRLLQILTERVGLLPAWLVVAPLRLGVILDAPLSRMLRYPYLSVALCAVRPPRVGEPPSARRGERSSAPA